MTMSNLTFEYLRYIRLDDSYCPFQIQRPDSISVAGTQAREPMATLARSVYFVVAHCPLLRSLHINPHCVTHKDDDVQIKTLSSVTKALQCLVKHYPDLEVIGVRVLDISVLVSTSGDFIADSRSCYQNRDIDLELAQNPAHAREDALQTWCNTSFREALKCDETAKFVSREDIEDANGSS
jgi:hypothetical protein